METIALALTIILFIAGVLGTMLPFLPGITLVYGGMILYGLMTKFASHDVQFFVIQSLILILVIAIDFFAAAIGTKKFGGSKESLSGAVTGTFLGLYLMGPLGMILGPFLGAFTSETIWGEGPKQAIKTGFGTLIGFIAGTLLKLAAEIVMIVYFFMQIA